MKTFKEYTFGVLKHYPAMLPSSEDDGEWVTGDPTKPIEGWEDEDVETVLDKSEKQIEKDRNTREVTEAAASTVKGWIHLKTKKVYLTKRMRPYHVEFIAKKPRDFGTNDKEILEVLEKWNDSMDAPNPKESAEKDLAKIKKGDIDIHRLVESLAMNKGWYRVVGNMWASEIAGTKINDKIIHDILNIMEDEGVIPYEGKDIKQLECREYQPDKNNAGYPDSKLIKLLVGDKILRALRGKKTGDKQTEIGRTMAMFREYVELTEGEWKDEKDEREHNKLFMRSLKTMPGSPKQKKIIQQMNALRKKNGLELLDEAKRVPKTRKNQDPDTHSDLYTDEDPRGTIHGLGFKDVETAEASVRKIESSDRSHAHKIQAAIAMEQRAKVMKKNAEAAVYRRYIEKMKKKTEKMNESLNLRSLAKNSKIASAIKKNKNKPAEMMMLALLSVPAFANLITPDNLNRANIIGSQLKRLVIGEEDERQEI